MEELTYQMLEDEGIDTSMIKTCSRIRGIAKLDRVVLDETTHRSGLNMQFISYCNDYIRDLYTSNLELDFDRIEVFSMLQQISFTSYGKDTFSSISILIDGLNVQHDYISKSVADSALVTYVQNLQLTAEQQQELKALLCEKYAVTSIKKIDLILKRVEDNLAVGRSGE